MPVLAVIYEWEAWSGYMLPALLPEATRLTADPFHSARFVCAKLPPALGAFAFHINCTKTEMFPKGREELADVLTRSGVAVLNACVTDTSKRALQRTCSFLGLPSVATTTNDGMADDPVIVKTDLNYGGYGERRLSKTEAVALGVTLTPSAIESANAYQVLARHKVPDAWWHDPDLVVERFIANSHDRKYRVYFAGPRYLVTLSVNPQQIKKYRSDQPNEDFLLDEDTMSRAAHPRLPTAVQIDVLRLLAHLRIDFGAVDFVEDDDGRCYIVDVNATSFGRGISAGARHHLRLGLLARIASLRKRPRPMISLHDYVDELLRRERRPQGTTAPFTDAAQASNRGLGATAAAPSRVLTVAAAPHYASPGDVGGIMCLFNVGASNEKLRNFSFASALLNTSGLPLVVVECAMPNEPFALPPGRGVMQVRPNSNLWQKERLLNLAVTRLPDHVTKVAWLDADMLFENPEWAIQVSEMLADNAVVQLFDRVIRLPRGRHLYTGDGLVWESFASICKRRPNALLEGDFAVHGHTGFGWAARREFVEQVGLYDSAIVGGGDHIMAHAFCGDWESSCLTRMMGSGSAWYRHAVEWSERAYPLVRARVGVVSGAGLHLWHGDLTSRRHVRRYEPLQRFGFDPRSDLTLGPEGCWEWSSRKPDLHRFVDEYMAVRRQEDTALPSRLASGA